MRRAGRLLDLGNGLFRTFHHLLRFTDIMLGGGIVFMTHHALDLSGVGSIHRCIGGGGMAETVHDNPGVLHAGQEQCFCEDVLNASGAQAPAGRVAWIPIVFGRGGGGKEWGVGW